MTDIIPSYLDRFTKPYAIVAAGTLIVFGVIMNVAPNFMAMPIVRGALIGGTIGAFMWPIQAFAQSFLAAEGRKTEGRESWSYAIRFARKALFINLALGVVAVIASFALSGVRVDEIGIAFGVMILAVGLLFGLQILMLRLFIWSAFKGAEKRAQRLQGG